ncbi:AAA family ATPase [Micropruina sp.]|uniref:AAA family ATPase n=1 Tax=Micropruina sp. TaxID=2737536 RepID=UPI0039E64F35
MTRQGQGPEAADPQARKRVDDALVEAAKDRLAMSEDQRIYEQERARRRAKRRLDAEEAEDLREQAGNTAPPGQSWRPDYVLETAAALREGTIRRTAPTVGEVGQGRFLFYEGKVNGIHGESGSGKSWTALWVCVQQLIDAADVVYIDLEDDEVGIVGRLLDLGLTDEQLVHFAYLHPEEAFTDAARRALLSYVEQERPTLVVIDSTGEALALDGARPNEDDDVARWFQRLPGAIARLGAAVVVLDHMAKADSSGLWPIGSQRKRAAISGAQYLQKTIEPFDKETAGAAELVAAKDRHGNYRAGLPVAVLEVDPTGPEGLSVQLVPVAERAETSPVDEVAHCMEVVSRLLEGLPEGHSGLTKRGVRERVRTLARGRNDLTDQALGLLVRRGLVSMTPGPRNGKYHRSLHPYRAAERDFTPTTEGDTDD